jgi:poly-gamma-glutamate synthase PgsB/CapB
VLPFAALRALDVAARRDELPAAVRRACADALLELDVRSGAARDVHAVLEDAVRTAPVGGSVRIASDMLARALDEDLARALAVLARDGFALGFDRTNDGALLYRGDRRGFAAWRALFEIRHPAPSKRQGVAHTLGYKPRGVLRAPPGLLAEVTATRVPGERVLAVETGDWGRHLPLVDDLLSCGVLRARPFELASGYGLTRVRPAPSVWRRMRAFCRLSWDYAHFAALRQQALSTVDCEVQSLYAREVERRTGIAMEIVPYAFDVSTSRSEEPLPLGLKVSPRPTGVVAPMDAMLLTSVFPSLRHGSDALVALGNVWDELVRYALSPSGNRLSQLAAYALVLLAAMVARGAAIRGRIESERRAIPLVMGGWGTRGKSGTERLKAALFHGLGYETLVKTTGCEAMFIHALPGLPAREIFIYRPYDKASVWEQRETLSLAHRLSVRVFLWECMALQPELVGLLQGQWMRDDYSTITNAYPDHEDVQGPTGLDVATTISEFVPVHGRLVTSEEQMLPVLLEQARTRGTRTKVVRALDAELIPDELLERFDYAEHPHNIALVAALARGFGIPETVAIAEMADNVVPDLGALKTYPAIVWRGRGLSFTNGMGANDRQGTLSNWGRAGFEAHDSDRSPDQWIVTLVNNRADRVARSEMFATLIVEDISAHCHVLIGTNVSGLLGFIETALRKHLERSAPCRNLPDDITRWRDVVEQRISRAFARLKLGRTDAQSVIAQCRALGFPPLARAQLEVLLTPASAEERYEDGRQVVLDALRDTLDAERLPFLTSIIARRRCVRALHALLDSHLHTAPNAVDTAFAAGYRAMFMESVVPLHDPELSGDAIIDRIAREVPIGAQASILGLQNIKGTGLDFAYRWVSIDSVLRMLDGLDAGTPEVREQALLQLMVHDDYGMIDAELALQAVASARAKAAKPLAAYETLIARLQEVVRARSEQVVKRRDTSKADRLRKMVGETLDFADAVRRRRMAKRVMQQLVLGRISHATAALRMRRIVARSKGEWMLERK